MNLRNKRKKFVELAESRVNRAIKDLKLIGNLSNRSAYDYTVSDVRQIFRALQREIDAARSRFIGKGGKFADEFKLEEK